MSCDQHVTAYVHICLLSLYIVLLFIFIRRRHSDASETTSSLGRPPKSHHTHHQGQDHVSHSKRQKLNQGGGTLTSEEPLVKKPKIKGGKSKLHVTELPVERDQVPLESALIK